MILAALFAILVTALCIEIIYRLALAAILWLPVVFCATAAVHWTASLHLSDPLAPLYAGGCAGVLARIGLEQVLIWLNDRRLS